MGKMKLWVKTKMVQWVMKSFLKTILEEEILRSDKNGNLIHRGKTLTASTKSGIILEAQGLNNSELLKILLLEMEFLGNKRIFNDSNDAGDMLGGKMVLWTVDVLRKKINSLSNLK